MVKEFRMASTAWKTLVSALIEKSTRDSETVWMAFGSLAGTYLSI